MEKKAIETQKETYILLTDFFNFLNKFNTVSINYLKEYLNQFSIIVIKKEKIINVQRTIKFKEINNFTELEKLQNSKDSYYIILDRNFRLYMLNRLKYIKKDPNGNILKSKVFIKGVLSKNKTYSRLGNFFTSDRGIPLKIKDSYFDIFKQSSILTYIKSSLILFDNDYKEIITKKNNGTICF